MRNKENVFLGVVKIMVYLSPLILLLLYIFFYNFFYLRGKL